MLLFAFIKYSLPVKFDQKNVDILVKVEIKLDDTLPLCQIYEKGKDLSKYIWCPVGSAKKSNF